MLELKNLSIKIGNNRKLIENLNFTLNPGDKIAVIGEEGNGKSTLMAAIADRKEVESFATLDGSINFSNERIGYLKQMIDPKLAEMLVCDIFTDFDDNSLYRVLKRLRLPSEILYSKQTINSLSGGEKIKIQLAKLLLEEPTIILLDEPSNDLDIKMLEWLENFINHADEAIMFISHDTVLLENCANGILHIEQLKRKTEPHITFSRVPYREYIERRKYNIERQNQIASKQRDQDQKRQERWQQIYNKVDYQQRTISRQDPHGARLLKKKMKAVKSQERRFERERGNFMDFYDPEEEIVVKFQNTTISKSRVVIDKVFKEVSIGNKILLKDINLKIVGPEKVVFIGENGVGKSTLIKEIYKYMLHSSIFKIGYMPQNYQDEFFKYTNVRDYLKNNTASKEELTMVMTMLGSLKFTEEEINGSIKSLSGGTKAKLFLAKIMAEKPDVLLLDEPTRNLSPLSSPVLIEAINSFDGAVICISHDRKFISSIATKIYKVTKNGLIDAFL